MMPSRSSPRWTSPPSPGPTFDIGGHGFDPVVTVGGINKVERWLWMDDWRTMVPLFVPVAGEGRHPMNPKPKQIRTELLRSFSYLRSAFTDDEAKTAITLYATTRDDNQILYNEDPSIGEQISEDFFITKQTAVAVYVAWPAHYPTTSSCDQATLPSGGDEPAQHDDEIMGAYAAQNYPQAQQQQNQQRARFTSNPTFYNVLRDLAKKFNNLPQDALGDAVQAAYMAGFTAGKIVGNAEQQQANDSSPRGSGNTTTAKSMSWKPAEKDDDPAAAAAGDGAAGFDMNVARDVIWLAAGSARRCRRIESSLAGSAHQASSEPR